MKRFGAPLPGGDFYSGPSFDLRNRLARLAWNIVYQLLFRTSPRPFHAWRRALLRMFGARIGIGVRIAASAQVWAPWNLHAHNYVVIGDGAIVYCLARVRLGSHSIVSQRAHLCGGSHDYESTNFQLQAKPIVLGRRVWVGAEAYVGPGVTIPDGTVLGARCVMPRSPKIGWAVYAGNPAVLLKVRRVRHG
jgi:putative colanic acid biosynthesis acetyltransferase WcaF